MNSPRLYFNIELWTIILSLATLSKIYSSRSYFQLASHENSQKVGQKCQKWDNPIPKLQFSRRNSFWRCPDFSSGPKHTYSWLWRWWSTPNFHFLPSWSYCILLWAMQSVYGRDVQGLSFVVRPNIHNTCGKKRYFFNCYGLYFYRPLSEYIFFW